MKSLKLINPCKEDWSNMTDVERGKHCSKCSKVVVDFSRLSQEEIHWKLIFANSEICARVTHEQIKTPLFFIEKRKERSIPFSKFAAGFLLASSMFSTQSCDSTEIKVPMYVEQNANIKNTKNANHKQSKNVIKNIAVPVLFKGKILSEKTGNRLQNAKVIFITLYKTYSTFTDEKGEFNLNIPPSVIKDKNVVRVSFQNIFKEDNDEGLFGYNSYKTENLVLSKKEINESFSYKAEPEIFYLGGVGVHHDENKINPIVIINGEQVQYEEFAKARLGKSSSCNLENKDFYFFEPRPAIVLFGESAKGGLFLLTNSVN